MKKLEELSEQVRYMGKYGIETFDDLYADRERFQREMDNLIAYRTKLQNKIRRASPAEKETLRQEKSGVTEQITDLAKAAEAEQRSLRNGPSKYRRKPTCSMPTNTEPKRPQQNRKSQRKEHRER